MENLEFKPKDFVHLHLHSDYSLLQSTIQLKPLAKRLTELEMKACAITDLRQYVRGDLVLQCDEIKRHQADHRLRGVSDIRQTTPRGIAAIKAGERPITTWCFWPEIWRAITIFHISPRWPQPRGFTTNRGSISRCLSEHSKGLIGLSSGFEGAVGHFIRQENDAQALENAKQFEDIFGKGNFYLEIQDHGLEHERKHIKSIVELSKDSGIPLVATNEPYFLNEEDARAQEILLCIGEGRTISEGAGTTLGSSKYLPAKCRRNVGRVRRRASGSPDEHAGDRRDVPTFRSRRATTICTFPHFRFPKNRKTRRLTSISSKWCSKALRNGRKRSGSRCRKRNA